MSGLAKEEQQKTHELYILDTLRGVKTSAELNDKDNNLVSLIEVLESIVEFIKTEADANQKGKPSIIMDQLLTLLCHTMHVALPQLSGTEYSDTLLSTGQGRYTVAMAMLVGVLLHQYMQENNLQITLFNEKLSDSDKTYYEELHQVQEAISIGLATGIPPNVIAARLISSGQISHQKLLEQLTEDFSSTDEFETTIPKLIEEE